MIGARALFALLLLLGRGDAAAGGAVPACARHFGPARIRTLAYVVTECREEAGEVTVRQAVRLRRGSCGPSTVFEVSIPGPVPDPLGLCPAFGEFQDGTLSVAAGALHRIGVTPDGQTVVFEVNDAFSVLFPPWLAPEQKGFFSVRSDGDGLRRLGPPSRDAAFRIAPSSENSVGFRLGTTLGLAFSPDGQRIAFTDLGPGPDGQDATQIAMLDRATGKRTLVTSLPSVPPPDATFHSTFAPRFIDRDTLLFRSFAGPGGTGDGLELRAFTVKTDGSELKAVNLPVSVPGSRVVPTFNIAHGTARVVDFLLPGTPVNHVVGFAPGIEEVFALRRGNLLQLTNFGREDTSGEFADRDGRIFFIASADPLGTNASDNCQLFSIDPLGSHLRQVTRFGDAAHSENGCGDDVGTGCRLSRVTQDPMTRALVFESTCDPLGANPSGAAIFAMRPNGAALHQLTNTRGVVLGGDGSVTVELPGPFGYPRR